MEAAIRERVRQWMEKRGSDRSNGVCVEADEAETADKSIAVESAEKSQGTAAADTKAATAEEAERTGEQKENETADLDGEDELAAVYSDVTELILDGRRFKTVTPVDAAVLQKLKNLSKLACNQTGLTSTAGFPLMPRVKTLELTDNHLTGGLEHLVKSFPNVKRLQLGGNPLKNYSDILPLKELTNLEHVGLDMSPLSNKADYREKIFEMLPQLQLLDSQDRQGKEIDAAASDEEDDECDSSIEADTTLKDFYEKDLEEEDEEDEEDFQPEAGDEEDEDFEDDDDAEEDGNLEEEDEDEEEEEKAASHKRKAETRAADSSVEGNTSSSADPQEEEVSKSAKQARVE